MKRSATIGLALALMTLLSVFINSAGLSQEKSDEEYNKFLIKALKNENIGIRSSAAQLLGERKVETAVKPLIKMLKTERHYGMRIIAALALYQIGSDEALSVLKEKAKHDRSKTVRHVLAGIVESMENTEYAKK